MCDIRTNAPKYFYLSTPGRGKERAQGWCAKMRFHRQGWKMEMADMSQNRQPQKDQERSHTGTNQNRTHTDCTCRRPNFLAHTEALLSLILIYWWRRGTFPIKVYFAELHLSAFELNVQLVLWLKALFFICKPTNGIMICLRQCWPLKLLETSTTHVTSSTQSAPSSGKVRIGQGSGNVKKMLWCNSIIWPCFLSCESWCFHV